MNALTYLSLHMQKEVTMNTIVRGAMAGIAGTVFMSVPVFASQRLGLFASAPPVEISASVAKNIPILPSPSSTAFSVAWPVLHLAYGAAGGIVFNLIRGVLPKSTGGSGLVLGGAVWAGSYLGYLPLLHLYPAAEDDAHERTAVMLVAHAVYGITLAFVEKALSGKNR